MSILVSLSELIESPSRRDGITLEIEYNNMIYACELVSQAGVMLELPTQVVCSAQVMVHRFFYRRSMADFAIDEVCQTAVFLATKVEECTRKVRDILSVFHWLLQKRSGVESPQPLLTTTENFNDRVRQLRNCELVMLNEFGYVLNSSHPHRHLSSLMHLLEGKRPLAQCAWAYLNDSMRTNCCLLYRPEVIACACVWLAARKLGDALPESPSWWQVLDVKLSDMEDVATMVLDLYERAPIQLIPVRKQGDVTLAC